MEGNVTADWALQLIRHQRHNLLNGLQVVLGWLQLNRPERAQEHLIQVIERLTHEMELIRNVPPETALQVCALILEAEVHDVTLQWERSDGDYPPSGEPVSFEQACAQVRACMGGTLSLRIATDGRLSVHNAAGEGKG